MRTQVAEPAVASTSIQFSLCMEPVLAWESKCHPTEPRLWQGEGLVDLSNRGGILDVKLGAPCVILDLSLFVFKLVKGFSEGVGKFFGAQRARCRPSFAASERRNPQAAILHCHRKEESGG